MTTPGVNEGVGPSAPTGRTFSQLVAEGQALRVAFDAATRPMRLLTAADLRRRSR